MTSSGPTAEMLGTSVGNYQIASRLGQGGMGVVYLARHSMLGRPAAVKVLRAELSNNREIVNRFFNEARAATAIRHPGIVEIYDFGYLPDGSAYIIMELLEGETLSDRIMQLGRFSAASALAMTRQIASALLAAHAQQIVHRDLKPENVFIVPDPELEGGERLKLLDFGIAKLAVAAGEKSQTRTGEVIGTPTFMSPEQCRGAGKVDFRSDLYSLGCLLYVLLCGRPPFIAEGDGDIIAHHLYFPPEPPSRHEPSIPHEVDRLVLALLAKAPDERPPSAAAVIEEIDRLSGERPRRPGSIAAPLFPAQMATSSEADGKRTVPRPTTLSGSTGASRIRPAAAPTMMMRPRARWAIFVAALGALALGAAALLISRGSGAPEKPRQTSSSSSSPQPSAPMPDAKLEEDAALADRAGADAQQTKDTIHFQIESVPSDAEVLRNGERVGRTPFRDDVRRTESAHMYTVRKRGYSDVKVQFTGAGDEQKRIELTKIKSSNPGPVESPRTVPSRGKDDGINPFAK